jgi:exonuclease V
VKTSRLRTLPYLPAHKRPEVITSKFGKEIVVNKVKVEDKERILKRGQVSLYGRQC